MFAQMPLKIGLKDEASFETFVTEQESLAVALNGLQNNLKQKSGGAFYLYGDLTAGKTHLLQAACRYVTELNQASVYLPMQDQSLPLIPDVLVGLEKTSLVCLDDFDTYIGDTHWELALANLLTKTGVQGHVVMLSGNLSMNDWKLATKELAQALINVLPIKVNPLTENEEIIVALQRHSETLGFDLPPEVGRYLMKHFSSDLQELLALLQILEQAMLVEKRILTKPFVKHVFDIQN